MPLVRAESPHAAHEWTSPFVPMDAIVPFCEKDEPVLARCSGDCGGTIICCNDGDCPSTAGPCPHMPVTISGCDGNNPACCDTYWASQDCAFTEPGESLGPVDLLG